MKSFLSALQFLTILPVRGSFDEHTLGQSTPFFPIVGLCIGAVAALADQLGMRLGIPDAIMNITSVILLAAMTGGLHLDGLADTADGFFSARPRERVLEIMGDSRIGTMGVLALVFVLALKTAGLSQLQGFPRASALLLAPLAGRCLIVFTIQFLPYAHQQGGLARSFFQARRMSDALWAALCLITVAFFLFGLHGACILLICGLCLAVVSNWSRRRIGGFSGDTLGATNEITEAFVIIVIAFFSDGG